MTVISKKFLLLSLIVYVMPSLAFSQLTLEQLTNINLGETFPESKPKIKALFTDKAKVMKADFFGAATIEYENTSFDYYGLANYTFQYAKDTLVSVQISFPFVAKDTIKFRRLYNTLLSDLKNDNSKKLVKQISNLNAQMIFKYIKANCVVTTEKENPNYKPISSKFLGQDFYNIYKNSIYSGKFLRLYVQVYERHSSNYENGVTTKYDGGIAEIVLELMSEKLQDLKYKEEEMEISNYHLVTESSEEIKLKMENNVYLIPIKLNSILTIDFVLDLGASDVSISPDIFLVLYRAGTIKESDFIGSQSYQFADGTIAKSNVFNIKSLHIGDREIKNVRASISNSLSAPLLLGQSALKQLNGYRIDNEKKLLIIE